jgi:hypothetical protein
MPSHSMKYFYAAIIALAFLSPAYATMPALTPAPDSPNPISSEKWAAEQDDDAIEMWGTQENGISSRTVALHRLADSCMGHEPPDIIGFGSSAGFDRAYCKKHTSSKLCKDVH